MNLGWEEIPDGGFHFYWFGSGLFFSQLLAHRRLRTTKEVIS
jgi:hypothetical protein